MESSVAKMNASCWLLVGPSNQLAFLLYSKNPTLIFSSLVAGDAGAMEDTCERLQLRYVPGELVLWVWLQSLEFTSIAMFPRDLSWKGPQLQCIQPQSNHLVWGPHCPGTNLTLSHRPSGWYRPQEVAWSQPGLGRPKSDPSSLQSFVRVSKPILTTHNMWALLASLFKHMLKGREKRKFMK